jgi:hypothetical protein
MAGTTKFDSDGMPIPMAAPKKDTTVLDKDGMPIPKKKENAGSPSPSGSSPKPGQTGKPVNTSGSNQPSDRDKSIREQYPGISDLHDSKFVDSVLDKNKDKNFVQRYLNPSKSPVIKNDDGSVSTHRMASSDNIAYPTIVQQPDGSLKQLNANGPNNEAYKYAIKNKEFIEFKNEKDADWFATNGYKLGNQNTEPVSTSVSDPKQVTANLKNNSLTTSDVGKVNGDGITPDMVKDAINNKAMFLSAARNAPSNYSSQYLVKQKNDVDTQIAKLENQSISEMEYGQEAVAEHHKKIQNLKDRSEYLNTELQKNYDYRLRSLIPELEQQIKPTITDDDFSPSLHTLKEKSVERIAGIVDSTLNKANDSVINARITGDLDNKKRTYADVTRQLVEHLNLIPIQKAQEEYKKEFAKSHPQIQDAINASGATKDYFENTNFDELKSKVKIEANKSYIETKNRYWGENGLFMRNKDLIRIQEHYAQLVGDGKMTDEVAKKQMDAEIKQNPGLQRLQKNYERDVKRIPETAQKTYNQYVIDGLKAKHPQYTIYKDNKIGLAGMSEDDFDKLTQEYQEGAEAIAEKMGAENNAAWRKDANEKAANVNPFWAGLGLSMDGLSEGLSKGFFSLTGWGGDNVRHYEAKEIATPSISESDQVLAWNEEGIEAMKDPNYFLFNAGQSVPVIAGAGAVGLATRGAGLPDYIEWLTSAGLFTGQSAVETFSSLAGSRDKNGNIISTDDAAHAAADVAKEDFLPNVLMMGLGSGTLLRAKNIVKPTIAGAIKEGLFGTAATYPLLLWQGHNDYTTMREAQGYDTDLYDYMQSKDFRDNLFNGLVIGGSISLLHAPMNLSKSLDNWTKMVHQSEGEFKNMIPENYALGQEFAGKGDFHRDALKLKIFNTDPVTLDDQGKRELADTKNALLYSTNLDRNIKAGNLDPTKITDLYQAHNLALADQHDYLSEQAAKEGNKSLSDIYKNKAKDYRSQAEAAAGDQAKFTYLVNGEGHPIFLSDRSFKTLEQEGTIAKWQLDGTIQGVHKSDDPDFAQRYKEFVQAKDEATVQGPDVMDHVKGLIEENKDKLGVHYEEAKKDPEGFLKDVADRAFGVGRNEKGEREVNLIRTHEGAEKNARETYGDDIVDLAKVLYPLTNKEGGSDAEKVRGDQKQLPVVGEEVGTGVQKDSGGNVQQGAETGTEAGNEKNKVAPAGAASETAPLPQEYKPQIRDDYFARSDFFTPEEKEKFQTLDDDGKDKMIDDKRAELKEKVGGPAGITAKIKSENPTLSSFYLKNKEAEALKKYAQENGLMLPEMTGEPHGKGHEQNVYLNDDGKTVTKVNPNKVNESWGALFKRIDLHNSLFPDTEYTLKGFSEDKDGNLSAVYEQPLITKSDEPVKYSEMREKLEKMGFEPSTSRDFDYLDAGVHFDNKKTGVRIADLTDGNVIKGTDGEIHFIDPFITQQKISDETEKVSEPGASGDERTGDSGGKGNAKKADDGKTVQGSVEGTGGEDTGQPPPPVVGPTNDGLHPHNEEWTSIQKKDLSERVQKENAFTQTNRETVDKVIGRLSQDAAKNGRTWQAQAEFETNALHNEFFNEDGTIKQAFNPTTEQLALIGIRLMDINGEASVAEFNPNDDQQTARTAYLENEKAKAERLLSFGEAGRAFQFRQSLLKMGINGDIQIKRKAISASVGVKIPENEEQFKQLSKLDQEKIKPIYDAFQNWKAEYEKENKARNTVDETYSKAEFDKQLKEAVAAALKEAKVPDKGAKITKNSSKKIADSLKSFADKFEKFGRADLPKGTQKAGFGPDIQKKIADAIRWVAEKIANGDIKIPELISEAIERFKDKDLSESDLSENIKNGLKEAGIDEKTLNAKTNRENILAKMKEMAKDSDVKAITQKMVDRGMVRDYLHDIAQRGDADPEKVLEKGVEELGKAFPGLDAKTLRDAYLKEGRFTPDKSADLKDQVKKAAQTFRDVTILQRDIEALEAGEQLYGADKETKTKIVSEYEQKLRDEKEKLLKERGRAARDIKDAQKKAEKLAEYDKRIADLDNHQKVWEKAKKGKGVDKDLAEKREELRKALIKNGVKLETGSKDSRAAKEKVIEAHNERVSNLKNKISDILSDDTVSDEDKKALRSVQSELNKMGVKIDAGDLNEKIKKAQAAASRLHTTNITNLLTGRKSEILSDLKNLSTQLKKDNNSALQDIQLEQVKDREVARKEQAERKLAAGDFEDVPKLSDYKKDEELLKLTRDRKKAEHDLAYQIDKYHKQNEGFWQRQITRLQRLQRANLISGIMTNGKVLVATVVKPVSDALVRRSVGTVTTPALRMLGLKGEREVLNNDATIRSFEDSFKGTTQRKAAEIRGTTTKALETATSNLQAANDQLNSLKGTPEYQAYKDNEYTKAVNDYQSAQYEWAAAAMYDFIAPNSWAERLKILQSGVSTFEESMGGYRGTTWADEKSKHAIGTGINRIIHTLEIFGRTHGAEKDISARQAFVEGFLKRASTRIKEGEQLTPSKLEGIALQSYNDFLGGKFQNKNPVAEAIRATEAKASEGGFLGKAFAFWLQSVTPVLKVPLNIEAEGLFKYTAGIPVAIGKTFYEIGKALNANDLTIKYGIKDFNGTMDAIREHMQSLPAEKRDSIIQYFNKGAIGLGLAMVAGSMAAKGNLVFGGAYGEGKKKRKFLNADTGELEELNYGEIAINGHKVGKFWSAVIMHLPPLMPAVMGATYVQKYKDERGDYKDEADKATAAFDGLSEVVRTAWEESALKSLGDIAQSPSNLFNSFTTQMAGKNISEYFDTDADGNLVERKGENTWQKILLRVGGRGFVPTKEQAEEDRANKIDDSQQRVDQRRQDDPYYEKNQK